MKRLGLLDLHDKELGWLWEVAENSLDKMEVKDYVKAIYEGDLGLWSVGGKGLVGLSRTNKVLWVEFIVGDDILDEHSKDLVALFKEQAEGRRIECLPHRKGAVRRAERFGFKPVAQLMRLEDA